MNPDRKRKIKRIIAREGLMILACLLLSLVLLSLQGFIPYEAPTYIYDMNTGGHTYIIESKQFIYPFKDIGKSELVKILRSKYPKEIEKSDNINWIPEDLKISFPKTKYSFKWHIRNLLSNLIIFFLIITYPVYLIIRFIIWALRTLRER